MLLYTCSYSAQAVLKEGVGALEVQLAPTHTKAWALSIQATQGYED